jgi:hypothetical protein
MLLSPQLPPHGTSPPRLQLPTSHPPPLPPLALPTRYAYTFQHYVLLTRMAKDRESRASHKPVRVLERSIFSDRMVFVRAMHEAG